MGAKRHREGDARATDVTINTEDGEPSDLVQPALMLVRVVGITSGNAQKQQTKNTKIRFYSHWKILTVITPHPRG